MVRGHRNLEGNNHHQREMNEHKSLSCYRIPGANMRKNQSKDEIFKNAVTLAVALHLLVRRLYPKDKRISFPISLLQSTHGNYAVKNQIELVF